LVGALGGSANTIGFDSADATDVPAAFEAVAVNEYVTPLVNPVITQATGFPIPLWVQLWVPPTTVTVNPKPCIAEPPLKIGRVNVTFTEPAANGVATRFVGASGAIAGTTFAETTDAAEVPAAFEAVTVNV